MTSTERPTQNSEPAERTPPKRFSVTFVHPSMGGCFLGRDPTHEWGTVTWGLDALTPQEIQELVAEGGVEVPKCPHCEVGYVVSYIREIVPSQPLLPRSSPLKDYLPNE
jgi:hypothetical protein